MSDIKQDKVTCRNLINKVPLIEPSLKYMYKIPCDEMPQNVSFGCIFIHRYIGIRFMKQMNHSASNCSMAL